MVSIIHRISTTFQVKQLTVEIEEAGEEVARWREACEWEVEAGKLVIEQQEKEVNI